MSQINKIADLPNQQLYESDPQHKKLKETCREFEAVMVSLVLKEGLNGAKEMSATPDDEEDSGTKSFKQFAYEQMSYCIGKSGMLGLGDHLYESMKDKIVAAGNKKQDGSSDSGNTLGRLLE